MSDYPYPKLMKGLDDYPHSSIDCELVEPRDSGGHIILEGHFNLDDEGIRWLVDDGYAGFALLARCVATNRSEFSFVGRSFSYRLTKANYAGQVTITLGVVMKERLESYTSGTLNADYAGIPIELPKGAMIAECEPFRLDLFRGSNPPTESICDFVVSDKAGLYHTDDGDKIDIHVPQEVFEKLKALRKRECSQIFTSMFVVPVIQDVVQAYWIDGEDPPATRWYSSLKAAIDSRYPGGLGGRSAFEVSTELLDSLMFDSAGYLAKHYGDSDVC